VPADPLTPTEGLAPLLRRAARHGLELLPADVRRRVQAARGRPPPRSVELGDLDAELAEADRRFATSEDEARAFLNGFVLAPPADPPADPFSDRYREWTWDLYRRVSGREAYSTDNERSPFDLDAAVARPYPYATGSTTVVGEELIARGLIIKALGLQPPGRIVEFGPGWSNLTVDLATMGFDVTGVEVEPRFSALAESRVRVPEHLEMVTAGMLEFDPAEPYDAAVFYESFHHCADHLAMLGRLHDIVRPGGLVLFAAEPVAPQAYPWGPRLDGYSLWSTRVHGWLELGFDPVYFVEALDRTGWRATRYRARDLSPLADLWLVRETR